MTVRNSTALVEEFILGGSFPCLAGRSAWRQAGIQHRHYAVLGDRDTAFLLAGDLQDFVTSSTWTGKPFTSFVATFDGPLGVDEAEFETLMWRQLQFLHDEDSTQHGWAEGYSSDPESARFAFSVAGHPFFVIGLHEQHSRAGRRPPFPMLAFNSHAQFDHIKSVGMWDRLADKIRKRDTELHGSINPNLVEYGMGSEARRYSGRHNDASWVCPFSAHTGDAAVAEQHTAVADETLVDVPDFRGSLVREDLVHDGLVREDLVGELAGGIPGRFPEDLAAETTGRRGRCDRHGVPVQASAGRFAE